MAHAPICVLGMHRSGTSCLTGLLEDAGVALGDVSKSNPFNLKGNQENFRIMHLHDAVLADAGASWETPPERPVNWSAERLSALTAILDDYRDLPSWGFKDPRSVFTLPGWLSTLPQLRFVGTFRHPLAVARSLERRSAMPMAAGLELWGRYNRQLLLWQKRFEFPLVDFDRPDPSYVEGVAGAFRFLGLSLPSQQVCFFEASLRTASEEDDYILPTHLADLYHQLRALAA